MWGESDSVREARLKRKQERRAEARRRTKAERYAQRIAAREKQRQEDEQLIAHLIQKMSGQSESAEKPKEPQTLSRGFGFSQTVQVAPDLAAGRTVTPGNQKPGEKAQHWSPPVPLKRPV